MEGITLLHGDSTELARGIPDRSIGLVLTDPPYNIGKAGWDNIENYTEWCIGWVKECERVLVDAGSLYIWHNDMAQIPGLLVAIARETGLAFRQMCIWQKPNFRGVSWKKPTEKNTLRNWFNICEYCLYFTKGDAGPGKTGLDCINSNPECYRPLKDWYAAEKERLGITDSDIAKKYTGETGRKPYMLRHYFRDSQFRIPTKEVWEKVYMPLGFGQSYDELRQSYEGLRQSYEGLRQSYEGLRPVHNLDEGHCNVWTSSMITGSESAGKNHICEKPVDILERIIRTSSRPGDTVLDLFMGSGSTGVACVNTGRKFIGIDMDDGSYETARQRTGKALEEAALAYTE